jgi:hypothetical protein
LFFPSLFYFAQAKLAGFSGNKKNPGDENYFFLDRRRGEKYDVNGFILVGGCGEIHPDSPSELTRLANWFGPL